MTTEQRDGCRAAVEHLFLCGIITADARYYNLIDRKFDADSLFQPEPTKPAISPEASCRIEYADENGQVSKVEVPDQAQRANFIAYLKTQGYFGTRQGNPLKPMQFTSFLT